MNIRVHQRGFSLLELIVVITIIALLAAFAVPVLGNFKRQDATLAATRQVQDEVDRARQLAISQRTTVYMVFCPAGFWSDPAYPGFASQTSDELHTSTNLFAKQLTGYTFVTLHSVGDQPGRVTPHYLAPWRNLPEGTFIALSKFGPRNTRNVFNDPPGSTTPTRSFAVRGFNTTNTIPFPMETTSGFGNPPRYVTLPYLAFDYLGRLASSEDEFIPLARGSVAYQRDPNTKTPTAGLPSIIETPPGNSTNSFNLIHIDWLTGRTRLEHQEISGG